MNLPGYAGHILYVNLSRGQIERKPLSEEWARTYIGGYGINNRLAYDLIPAGADSFSPENALILGTGPFNGTFVPGASKILVTTKFPINGAFATASGGGRFALMLKSCGYDHLVITGKSPKRVYLLITQDEVQLCPADSLWGKDSFETTDVLWAKYEPCSVIPVGQAGENLVKSSITTVDKGGTLGRGGLPAVMASKNLKALVAVQGTTPLRVAHRLELLKLVNALWERIQRWPGRERLLQDGMMTPPPALLEAHRRQRQALACPSCPLAEKELIRLKEGKYAGLKTYMPHLSPVNFNGSASEDVYGQSIKWIDALNRYGICRMTFSALFPLVIRLYQQGVITGEDTEGLELRDDLETALKLMEMMAFRRGLGGLLAEGPLAVKHRFGEQASALQEVKGQAMVYDARLKRLGTMEFEQIVNPRGAHVASGGSPAYEPGRPLADFVRHGERMGMPEDAIKRIVGPTSFNPGRFTRYSEDWYALFNCLGLCNRAFVNRFYHVKTIAQLYQVVTGLEATPAALMKVAERAWILGKALNDREGFGRRDDRPPESWFEPLLVVGEECFLTDYYGTTRLAPEDIEHLTDDYYNERGYEPATGRVSAAKLKELGLEEVTADLEPRK